MRNPLGMHRVDELHAVDMLCDVGKQIGDRASALAVLLEGPWGLHDPLVAAESAGVGELPSIVKGDHLPIVFFQNRLGIKRVYLADPTLHEQKDHSLDFGSVMQSAQAFDTVAWLGILFGSGSARSEQPVGSQGTETAGRGFEELTSSEHRRWVPRSWSVTKVDRSEQLMREFLKSTVLDNRASPGLLGRLGIPPERFYEDRFDGLIELSGISGVARR